MRRIVFQRYFAMMCMNDGLTEREPKSEASAAVANRISPGKEHFKKRQQSMTQLCLVPQRTFQKHAPLVRPGYQGRYR